MSDPEIIEADAVESMNEAPPERTTVQLPPDHLPVTRPQHHGLRSIAGTELSVVPADHELAQLAQMAVTIAGATTAPKALQNKPNDVFMVMLTARDVGVGLTTAIREFHVIDGKVTLSPKVKLAMVRQQGVGRVYPHQAPRKVLVDGEYVEQLCPCGETGPANGPEGATWHAERADEPGILNTSTFTMEMARRVHAKENSKTITLADKSTWKQYPQRMVSWRALGYLLDDVFPEVGTGLYSPDEMGAVTDEDGVPVIDVVGSSGPVPGTKAPRGHNQPPPPPASDDVRAELQARIEVIKQTPEAAAVLRELWTAPREDGTPALPALPHLLASQVIKATSMISSVEQRIDKGEWPSEAAGASGDPVEGEADRDAPEAGSDDHGTGSEDAVVSEVIAEVQAIPGRPELVELLKADGLSTSGNIDSLRRRLAEHLVQQRTAAQAVS